MKLLKNADILIRLMVGLVFLSEGIQKFLFVSTKVPMLLQKGFWTAAHESRTDYSMLMGLLFLIVKSGPERKGA